MPCCIWNKTVEEFDSRHCLLTLSGQASSLVSLDLETRLICRAMAVRDNYGSAIAMAITRILARTEVNVENMWNFKRSKFESCKLVSLSMRSSSILVNSIHSRKKLLAFSP